jgi:hypothetical protein
MIYKVKHRRKHHGPNVCKMKENKVKISYNGHRVFFLKLNVKVDTKDKHTISRGKT